MRHRNPAVCYPRDATCNEWLRFLVQSSPPDAGELPFLVSMWSYCLRFNGLTGKQRSALEPYFEEARAWIASAEGGDEEDVDGENVVKFPGGGKNK